MVNYTHFRTNLFRVGYIVGAIALVAAIHGLNFGLAIAAISVAGYILVGWVVLLRLRQVVSLSKAA